MFTLCVHYRARLNLVDLSMDPHPLLLEGRFSIFNDARVRHTSHVHQRYDLDGVCFVSRLVVCWLSMAWHDD